MSSHEPASPPSPPALACHHIRRPSDVTARIQHTSLAICHPMPNRVASQGQLSVLAHALPRHLQLVPVRPSSHPVATVPAPRLSRAEASMDQTRHDDSGRCRSGEPKAYSSNGNRASTYVGRQGRIKTCDLVLKVPDVLTVVHGTQQGVTLKGYEKSSSATESIAEWHCFKGAKMEIANPCWPHQKLPWLVDPENTRDFFTPARNQSRAWHPESGWIPASA